MCAGERNDSANTRITESKQEAVLILFPVLVNHPDLLHRKWRHIMENHLNLVVTGLIAVASLSFAAGSASAATVDINVGLPGVVAQPVYVQPQPVYVQPRPVYVQPQYENDWRERHVRAATWRDTPSNHGQVVSAAAHERNDMRKGKHKKHHGKNKHDD
jgi:hypothetical protein